MVKNVQDEIFLESRSASNAMMKLICQETSMQDSNQGLHDYSGLQDYSSLLDYSGLHDYLGHKSTRLEGISPKNFSKESRVKIPREIYFCQDTRKPKAIHCGHIFKSDHFIHIHTQNSKGVKALILLLNNPNNRACKVRLLELSAVQLYCNAQKITASNRYDRFGKQNFNP